MAKKPVFVQVFFIGRNDLHVRGWRFEFKAYGLKIYSILPDTQPFDLMEAETADIIIADVDTGATFFKDCELIRLLLKLYPDKKIVGITNHFEQHKADTLIKLGAHGYIIRAWPDDETYERVVEISKGAKFFLMVDETNWHKTSKPPTPNPKTEPETKMKIVKS